MPILKVQKFIYRNLVKRPRVSKSLDRFGRALNKIGLPYATGLTRDKAILYASNNPLEISEASKRLAASERLRSFKTLYSNERAKTSDPRVKSFKILQDFISKVYNSIIEDWEGGFYQDLALLGKEFANQVVVNRNTDPAQRKSPILKPNELIEVKKMYNKEGLSRIIKYYHEMGKPQNLDGLIVGLGIVFPDEVTSEVAKSQDVFTAFLLRSGQLAYRTYLPYYVEKTRGYRLILDNLSAAPIENISPKLASRLFKQFIFILEMRLDGGLYIEDLIDRLDNDPSFQRYIPQILQICRNRRRVGFLLPVAHLCNSFADLEFLENHFAPKRAGSSDELLESYKKEKDPTRKVWIWLAGRLGMNNGELPLEIEKEAISTALNDPNVDSRTKKLVLNFAIRKFNAQYSKEPLKSDPIDIQFPKRLRSLARETAAYGFKAHQIIQEITKKTGKPAYTVYILTTGLALYAEKFLDSPKTQPIFIKVPSNANTDIPLQEIEKIEELVFKATDNNHDIIIIDHSTVRTPEIMSIFDALQGEKGRACARFMACAQVLRPSITLGWLYIGNNWGIDTLKLNKDKTNVIGLNLYDGPVYEVHTRGAKRGWLAIDDHPEYMGVEWDKKGNERRLEDWFIDADKKGKYSLRYIPDVFWEKYEKEIQVRLGQNH